MKVFTAVLFLGTCLVLIGMPEGTFGFRTTTPVPPPGPHEVYSECGSRCQKTCASLQRALPCPRICKRGNVCVDGYIRQSEGGPCVLLSECPQSSASSESSE